MSKFKIGDKVRRIKEGKDDYIGCTERFPKGYVGEVVGFGPSNGTIKVSFDNYNCLNTKGKYWELVKETGIKVETAELQFIRDDKGKRHLLTRDNDHIYTMASRDKPKMVYDYMVQHDYITPDPLEKALEAVDASAEEDDYGAYSVWKNTAKDIIRTLFEEMENKND